MQIASPNPVPFGVGCRGIFGLHLIIGMNNFIAKTLVKNGAFVRGHTVNA
jgi:hypothetical protein